MERDKVLYLFYIGILAIFVWHLLGAYANLHTVMANDCKMPVFTDYQFSDGVKVIDSPDNIHFYYNNFSYVNYPILTDILKYDGWTYSIGDLMQYLTLPFIFIWTVVTIYILYKSSRRKSGHSKD